MMELRGFDTTDQMDEALVDAINRVVGYGDQLYHLGDVSFTGVSRTCELLDTIKADIYLIPGNHDKGMSAKVRAMFKGVLEPIHTLKVPVHKGDGTNDVHRFVLSHFPLLVWDRAHHGAMHLHGHSHGTLRYPNPNARIMDVGVDAPWCRLHYGPITLDQVLRVMETRGYQAFDQHGSVGEP